MRDFNERTQLAEYGVHFADTAIYALDGWDRDLALAMDAQPGLVTTSNAGIPGFLTNIVDPEVVRVLVTPMKAAVIFGETKKGDWTTLSTQFPIAESAGQVASYGDYSNNGTVDANANWVPRQSYTYQIHKRYGERQLALWGTAAINYSAELDASAARIMNKFQNRSYFFGISGLVNYGFLNDPGLIAPSAPAVKAAGGTSWTTATAQEIYTDVLNLYNQLLVQTGYNIDMDEPLVLALPSDRAASLMKVSAFNITAKQTITETFPNLRIETAPEYSTAGGELMQLIAPRLQNVQTAYGAFTEKMRQHPLIVGTSYWTQKLSGGTWGGIIRRYVAVAQMLGI
jgi:hypothetical protein